MKTIILLPAIVLLCACNNNKRSSPQLPGEEPVKPAVQKYTPYRYDTLLKGGYHLVFRQDDSLDYLYLAKGEKVIAELSSGSKGLPHQHLGWCAADFENYFVLAHSFGPGNPVYIELVAKRDGRNHLPHGAAFIDADTANNVLLFCNDGVPDANDKMRLLNVETGENRHYPFPAGMFTEPGVPARIRLHSVTGRYLTISYKNAAGGESKLQRYNR